MEIVQVQTAHDDRDALQAIIDDLVDRRLVACGQIVGPIRSTFTWQGKVESADEWLALLKTTAELAPRVIGRIRETHSYQVPELVTLPIESGDLHRFERTGGRGDGRHE